MNSEHKNTMKKSGRGIKIETVGLWVVLCLALVLCSCGKKADPFIPKEKITAVLAPVTASYQEGKVLFTGGLVGRRSGQKADLEKVSVMVEYGRYRPDHVPCDSCPIDFTVRRVILGEVRARGKFEGTMPIEAAKGVYLFRLRIMGRAGALGPPSEIVRLVVS